MDQEIWKDIDFRIATTAIARMFGETIEIELPKVKFKPYNAQIWKNDDIVFESDFGCEGDEIYDRHFWNDDTLECHIINNDSFDIKEMIKES